MKQVTTNKNIDTPNSNSIWKVEGNNKLTPNTPIKLNWLNDQKKVGISGQFG